MCRQSPVFIVSFSLVRKSCFRKFMKLNHWIVLCGAAMLLVITLLFGFFGLGGVKGSFTVAVPAMLLSLLLFQIWRKRLRPTDY